MSFEVASLCDAIDKMMQKHLPPEEVRRRYAAAEPPDHLLEIFAEMGLFQLVLPEKEGGLGGSWAQLSIIQERLGYHATMAALLYNRVPVWNDDATYSASRAKSSCQIYWLVRGFCTRLSEAGAGSDAGPCRPALKKRRAGKSPAGKSGSWRCCLADGGGSARGPASTAGGRDPVFSSAQMRRVSMTRLDKIGNAVRFPMMWL